MQPWLQRFMPQHAISRFAGWLANSECPWLKNKLIRYFVNKYPVNLAEATEEDPYQYLSYNAFFTRSLKPGLRPIADGLHDFVSPADGCISMLGGLETGTLLQAKGRSFTVRALLGGDETLASPFQNGRFLTVYLAPQDYHRVHMPMDAHLTDMIYVPGELFSVNNQTAECVANLFARNERVVALFNTSQGRLAVILVGAMIVGSIETVWAGTVAPRLKDDNSISNTPAKNENSKNYESANKRGIKTFSYKHPIFFRRGEEMGRFKLGSTVIVLTESKALNFNLGLEASEKVVMGQKLGEWSRGV